MKIRFNSPHTTGHELEYLAEAISSGQLAGNGSFTKRCQRHLEEDYGAPKVLLTHSCTGALDMAAILSEVGPGDEVIMPSFTFVSTANAFVLRGATPVFVDIEPDTFNIDPEAVANAITPRTKVIAPVHYAGVSCDMNALNTLANDHQLLVIEDAAQAIRSTWEGQPVGAAGNLACLSFHETKNLISGEGGALIINDPAFVERAEIVWEKGTNRTQFFRGEVDKYSWVDVGSSFLPSELVAAFLLAQLEHADEITRSRLRVWHAYHERLARFEEAGLLRRPKIPAGAGQNGHIYHVLLPTPDIQAAVIDALKSQGIGAVFHYVPLHDSIAGRRYGRASGSLQVTDHVYPRLVRLPVWPDLDETSIDRIVSALEEALGVAPPA